MPLLKRDSEGLTIVQKQAITLLSTGVPVSEVAQEIGMDKSSIYRWMSETEFSRALNKATEDFTKELLGVALGQLQEVLTTGRNTDRLRAIELILSLHGKINKGNNINFINNKIEEPRISVEDLLKEIEGM